MSNDLDPIAHQWYQHLDKGQRFYVTAVDDEHDTVEVQHFDGDVEEFSFAEWRRLDIALSEEPESWSGAVDIADEDDFGTDVTDTTRQDWDEAQNEFRNKETESAKPGLEDDDYDIERLGTAISGTGEPVSGNLADFMLNLNQRSNGVYEEILDDTWYAQYRENPDTRLWEVTLFKHDVPEWQRTHLESLEDAIAAAQSHYSQV